MALNSGHTLKSEFVLTFFEELIELSWSELLVEHIDIGDQKITFRIRT